MVILCMCMQVPACWCDFCTNATYTYTYIVYVPEITAIVHYTSDISFSGLDKTLGHH